MSDKPFAIPLRVYIEDTDAGGIVFYANYLKYFERARTELVRSKGFDLRSGLSDGVSYVVHSLEVKYLRPALLDDMLSVSARVTKMARTYFVVEQHVSNNSGECLVAASVKVACVSYPDLKPKAIAEKLASALT